ncbi:MAG: hypothetical protein M3Z04_17400 [Chloroflexota bacterium]|nr:hypothetical protein [Chloroflexota bacterium]
MHNPLTHLHAQTRLALAGVTVAILLAPTTAWAHEKWFTDPAANPVRLDLLISGPVALALGVAALALGALLLLRRWVHDPLWPNPAWLRPAAQASQAVIGIQTAVSLIYMAVQGWLFSPVQPLPAGSGGLALGALVIAISLSFVTGWFTRLGGALLIALVALAFVLYPTAYALEQLLFAGIGLYFLLLGRGLFLPTGAFMQRLDRFWQPYARFALPAIRIGTGLTILVLAFTEKLLNPALAAAFLHTHPLFNFPQALGFTLFTDDLFIVAAAVVEATIGVLLIAGVLPRLVILLMWVPFNIAIPILPPVELLGHLPILAVMYAIFLQGPGRTADQPQDAVAPAQQPVLAQA